MDASFAVESDIAQMAELNSAASTRVGKMTKAAEMEAKGSNKRALLFIPVSALKTRSKKWALFWHNSLLCIYEFPNSFDAAVFQRLLFQNQKPFLQYREKGQTLQFSWDLS